MLSNSADTIRILLPPRSERALIGSVTVAHVRSGSNLRIFMTCEFADVARIVVRY